MVKNANIKLPLKHYNNNTTIGYRPMKIFLQRYGIYLSTTTIHKYMNKDLNLSAIVMRKKPGYESCKKRKTQQWNTSAQRSGSTIYILGVCQFLQGNYTY